MNDDQRSFALACRDGSGSRPVLAGVQATGRLDGVLFELTLRQTYRNDGDKPLEVVYTFPLPHEAVMLGFATELDGARKVGAIVAKREAERQYERALASGDAPVMLEVLGNGLHTANIGNLKPGEQIVLEVRFGQLLRFEQGRLRLSIPTTVAPRFGNAESAGLQPQQVPHASLQAEYPLSLSITLASDFASAGVECPTHAMQRFPTDAGLRLELARSAWLDRDVVIVVTPREARPSLLAQARDETSQTAPLVLMAALQPPATTSRAALAVKLLVDCSGSMGGDSIASARRALLGVLASLAESDEVSFSRFGSTVEHPLAPSVATASTLRLLRPLIASTDATLGGTEMEAALRAVFALSAPARTRAADVLLITDGEIWQAQEVIDAARTSRHRVFAIGVGASPAEGVLRALAEATGGACEFATPGEALEAAAHRMVARMRQPAWRDMRIDWGAPAAWQTPLPAGVFGGDTVIAFAGFAAQPGGAAIRLLARDGAGASIELARCEAGAPAPGDSLPRIAASRRLAQADERQALQLAIAYQLMSARTNCVLVHQRAEADKVNEAAELHRVGSMLAAGWGGSGSVVHSMSDDVMYDLMDEVQDFGVLGRSAAPDLYSVSARQVAALHVESATLRELTQAVAGYLSHVGLVQGLAAHCEALEISSLVRRALGRITALGASDGEAWLLLAHWVTQREDGVADASVAAALQPHAARLDARLVASAAAAFDHLLGDCSVDAWGLGRRARLARLTGAGQS